MDVENNATSDSIRDSLASAFDSVAESNEVTTSNPMEQQSAIDRQRDEQGRFAKKVEEQTKTDALESTPVEQQVTPPVAQKKAPQSWRQELKTHFDTLPPEVQDEILRRETDYSKGIQKYAESAKLADTLKPVIEQWAPYLNTIQATPESAFQALLQTEYVLRTAPPSQKIAMLQKLANDYGIDLGVQGGEQQHSQHPDLQHALQKVTTLERQLQQIEYHKQQEVARQEQAEIFELSKQVQAFKDSGNAPHYEQVSQDMAQLLRAGYADSLEDAYEKACWARPDIRSSLLAEQQAKQIQTQEEAARKAKSKAISITGSPSGAAVPITGASIRADLEAAWGGNRI